MNIINNIGAQIIDSFANTLNKIIELIPNVLGALVVLIVGAYIARFIQKVVKELLRTIKLEALSERLGVEEKIKSVGINSNITAILAGLIYWLILLVFISAASQVLNVGVVTQFINKLIGWLPAIFAGLVIMVVGVMVAETLSRILENVRYGKAYKTVVRWFILIIAFITAIEQIGIDISFLTENLQIVVAGIALAFGIAFGLGGRDKAKEFLDKHIR